MTFQEKLARLTRNMRLTSVAKDAGLTSPTLSAVITGKHSPRLVTIIAIANALEVDVKWLIDPAANWPPVRVQKNEPEPATAA